MVQHGTSVVRLYYNRVPKTIDLLSTLIIKSMGEAISCKIIVVGDQSRPGVILRTVDPIKTCCTLQLSRDRLNKSSVYSCRGNQAYYYNRKLSLS